MKKHLFLCGALCAASLFAAEYFVSPQGSDQNDGLSASHPFQTCARAVTAITAGDTLTLLPGVYHEGIEFTNFSGSDTALTTIRAAIPGTAVLRGDRDAPPFTPSSYSPRIWQCDLDFLPEAVNERDTLTIYQRYPSVLELDFKQAGWTYDENERRLYVHTSDSQPPANHYLTTSDRRSFGVLFAGDKVTHILIDGLTITGFNASSPSGNPGSNTKWGVYISSAPSRCTVRRVTAFLNGGGIGISGRGRENFVEDCRAYSNHSPNYSSGGNIIILTPNDNGGILRCVSFDSGKMGIRYYGGDPAQNCLYEDNISFDNAEGDLWMKYPSDTTVARRCIASNAIYARRIENSLFNYGDTGYFGAALNSIVRPREKNFSEDREFADPVNFDYRPQSDSTCIGRGPAPFSPLVFFVSAEGNDEADGNSVRTAWKSLAPAQDRLQNGATIYILPGANPAGDLQLSNLNGVMLRGRGSFPVSFPGRISLENCSDIRIERLIPGQLDIRASRQVRVSHCVLATAPRVSASSALEIRHNAFTGGATLTLADCSDFQVTGNIFADQATFSASGTSSGWSDANAYAAAVPAGEPNSLKLTPDFDPAFALRNGHAFAGRALDGMPIGPYRRQPVSAPLQFTGLNLLSTTATTANIDIFTSLPAGAQLRFGTTPDCPEKIDLDNGVSFQNVGLSGLKPATTYYFQVNAWATAPKRFANQSLDSDSANANRKLLSETRSFTTPATETEPVTYHVASQGDDRKGSGEASAPWRSITHAATRAKAGDTVMVHAGTYAENVRIRATGDLDRPLTFRAAPGAKVWISGSTRQLSNGFSVVNKKHVILDFFYFHWQQEGDRHAGVFAKNADSLQLNRLFYDGRGQGYAPPFVVAQNCRDLAISNCFLTRGFSGSRFSNCPGLHIRNSVFYSNSVTTISISNNHDEPVLFEKNIVVDQVPQKVVNPIFGLLDGAMLTERDNAYFLRIPPDLKTIFGFRNFRGTAVPLKPDDDSILCQQWRRQGRFANEACTYAEFMERTGQKATASFADPQLPALPAFVTFSSWEDWLKRFPASQSTVSQLEFHETPTVKPLDFSDFISGNADLRQRDIGLQPDAFAAP